MQSIASVQSFFASISRQICYVAWEKVLSVHCSQGGDAKAHVDRGYYDATRWRHIKNCRASTRIKHVREMPCCMQFRIFVFLTLCLLDDLVRPVEVLSPPWHVARCHGQDSRGGVLVRSWWCLVTGQPQKILPLPGRIAGASGGYAPSLLLSNLSCGVLPTSMLNGWLAINNFLEEDSCHSSVFLLLPFSLFPLEKCRKEEGEGETWKGRDTKQDTNRTRIATAAKTYEMNNYPNIINLYRLKKPFDLVSFSLMYSPPNRPWQPCPGAKKGPPSLSLGAAALGNGRIASEPRMKLLIHESSNLEYIWNIIWNSRIIESSLGVFHMWK